MAAPVITLIGTAQELQTSGSSTFTQTWSLPAAAAIGSIIRVLIYASGFSPALTDSQGGSFVGPTSFVGAWQQVTTADRTTADTVTLTCTPFGGGLPRWVIATAYCITNIDGNYVSDLPIGLGSGINPTRVSWSTSNAAIIGGAEGAIEIVEFITDGDYASGSGAPIAITPTFSSAMTLLTDQELRVISAGGFYRETDHITVGYRLYPNGNVPNTSQYCDFNTSDPAGGNLFFRRAGFYFYNVPPGGIGDIPDRGLCVLTPPQGGFLIAYEGGGAIKCRQDPTPAASPQLGAEVAVTTGTKDRSPRLAIGQGGRIYCLFRRGSEVYRTFSDGDGADGTWNIPTLMFSGCKRNDICYDEVSRTFYFLARQGSTGHLFGSIKGPGDASPLTGFTLTDDSGNPLVADNDDISVSPARGDAARRWLLAFYISGVYTVWQCTDDGASWVQVV